MGTLFSEIEELAVQIGDAVCREFIQQAAAEQAEQWQQEDCCPGRGGPLEQREPEPKLLLTRRGEVSWSEPQAYCKQCRKAFFPQAKGLEGPG